MGALLKIESPYDGRLIKEIPMSTQDEVERMIQQAAALFGDRDRWLPKFERIKILTRLKELMIGDREPMAMQASGEGGKPYTDSIIEIDRAINGVDIAIQELARLKGVEIPMELTESSARHMAYTMMEPAGVVVAISAFNHPINLIIHQVIPAVAAGCPVIVKPARTTPLSCLDIVEKLYQAGLPRQWCQVAICSNEVAAKLAADERIRFVTFIGSARVGWNIRRNLAPGVRCALEHGGAAPVIVEPDAQIDAILPGLVKAGYYHAGQVCVSVQRIFAHKDVLPDLKAAMASMVKALRVGDPVSPETEVGPLILNREVDRVAAWVTEAQDGGAELLAGGSKISASCYEPTLLVNPPLSSKVSRQEVFGPVVSLYAYDDYREAVALANDVPYSFQASVFTNNINTALDCVKRLKAKAVMVNEHTAFRVDWMPFGGAEHSGLGMGGIGYSMRDMCSEKLMVIKSDFL